MRLYGHDIDDTTTPVEAGLGWIVGWQKTGASSAPTGCARRRPKGRRGGWSGFELTDRGIARHGHTVVRGRRAVGVVTSGTQTPFLKKAIGMAYVPADARRGRHVLRHRHPRQDDTGRGGAAAVLQTRVVPLAGPHPYRTRPTDRGTMAYPATCATRKTTNGCACPATSPDIGITDYAQQQLGDVVYVDLPAVGTALTAGAVFGTIESVKAVSELFAPVSGTVTEVNGALKDHPEFVNSAPARDVDGRRCASPIRRRPAACWTPPSTKPPSADG